MAFRPDVALVSLGTTPGLRHSDDALAALIRDAGASCQVRRVRVGLLGRLRRHPAVTDLIEAVAARRTADGIEARAVVYSTITAALLHAPRAPYAVRFDGLAGANRPGLGGLWQRTRERPVLERARLLLPTSEAAAAPVPPGARAQVVRLPIPVEEIAPAARRDLDAVTYAGYPRRRGLELVCRAWAQAGPAGGRLVVGGLDRERGRAWLERCGVPEPPGVEWAGALAHEHWRATVARARVFVNGSRWEDYGLAQMEALAAGTPLVTVPTPGPNEALLLARALAPELVAGAIEAPALTTALRRGLAMSTADRAAWGERARTLLVPYRFAALREVVAAQVLPALGLGAR